MLGVLAQDFNILLSYELLCLSTSGSQKIPLINVQNCRVLVLLFLLFFFFLLLLLFLLLYILNCCFLSKVASTIATYGFSIGLLIIAMLIFKICKCFYLIK